jgi:nicotinate-nucleotide adenylyltransferase
VAEGDKGAPRVRRVSQGKARRNDVQGFPMAFAGEAIGLLGGSFDPAHEGHAHITREALKRFGLDRVWWLVSPGNPLKPRGPAPMADRMARARAVMDHPRVVVSDVEARLGTRYTARTLRRLMALYPGVRFVWLMGADNLAEFHRWQEWDWIMRNVPIGVIARPGARLAARGSRAADEYARYRLPASQAARLAGMRAPAWCFLNVPMVAQSSSAIRARGEWRRAGESHLRF